MSGLQQSKRSQSIGDCGRRQGWFLGLAPGGSCPPTRTGLPMSDLSAINSHTQACRKPKLVSAHKTGQAAGRGSGPCRARQLLQTKLHRSVEGLSCASCEARCELIPTRCPPVPVPQLSAPSAGRALPKLVRRSCSAGLRRCSETVSSEWRDAFWKRCGPVRTPA